MTASELMTRDVVTISPLTDAASAARMLTERRITGAPVVDQERNILGVVSLSDLARLQGGERPEGWKGAVNTDWPEDNEPVPVVALMTPHAITCDERTPIEEVARIMLERRVHRLLVTSHGKLTGIITAMDVLRAVAAQRAIH